MCSFRAQPDKQNAACFPHVIPKFTIRSSVCDFPTRAITGGKLREGNMSWRLHK